MAGPTKRLGRGLSSLMGSTGEGTRLASQLDEAREGLESGAGKTPPRYVPFKVPLDCVHPNPDQPRRTIKESGIAKLAESIGRSGLIQPIVVRPAKSQTVAAQDNRMQYELVAGERRWRAARAAGLVEVPAVVRDADEAELLELALVENIHREDLNAIDRAKAYEQFKVRFDLNPADVAKRVGEDRTTVTNYLRLLELPALVRDMVAQNLISMGHARAVLGIADEASQVELARQVVTGGLSVRATEDLVRAARGSTPAGRSGPGPRKKRPLIRSLESQFSERLSTKVLINESKSRRRGRIVIEYNSLDDFDRVCERLGLIVEDDQNH